MSAQVYFVLILWSRCCAFSLEKCKQWPASSAKEDQESTRRILWLPELCTNSHLTSGEMFESWSKLSQLMLPSSHPHTSPAVHSSRSRVTFIWLAYCTHKSTHPQILITYNKPAPHLLRNGRVPHQLLTDALFAAQCRAKIHRWWKHRHSCTHQMTPRVRCRRENDSSFPPLMIASIVGIVWEGDTDLLRTV